MTVLMSPVYLTQFWLYRELPSVKARKKKRERERESERDDTSPYVPQTPLLELHARAFRSNQDDQATFKAA
jgi:hypothetical protein